MIASVWMTVLVAILVANELLEIMTVIYATTVTVILLRYAIRGKIGK